MKYTFLKTERNGANLEFGNFTYTKKVKMKTLRSRRGDARIDVAKVLARQLKAPSSFLTNPHYHEANPAKKELVQTGESPDSRAVQSLEPPRVVVQMSTNNNWRDSCSNA